MGRLYPCQHLSGSFRHYLRVSPGAEHAGAHRQLKIQERPTAAKVLQRLPGRPPGRQGFQLCGLFRGQGPVRQPGVLPCHQPEQLPGVKIRIRAACDGQASFHLPQGLPGLHSRVYHLPSSGFSGRTGVTAAMATSIMLSSGSNTVRCCTQIPGCRMIRVAMLSERPHHLSSS